MARAGARARPGAGPCTCSREHAKRSPCKPLRVRQAQVWSFASLMSSGDSVATKFPLCFVWEEQLATPAVRRACNLVLCKLIDWSVRACEDGIAPLEGPNGEQFCPTSRRHDMRGKSILNGGRAVFAGWKGDGKARKTEYYGTQLCAICIYIYYGIDVYSYTGAQDRALL